MNNPIFIPNQIYNRRRDLNLEYGGSRQNGICTVPKHKCIFIFSGGKGHLHGYEDGWFENNIFHYTGEGQKGDMKYTRGNLALRDHFINGIRVFLFQSTKQSGYVQFISEMVVFDYDYFPTKDTDGNLRVGIKFFMHRYDEPLPPGARSLKELSPPLYNLPASAIENLITEREGLVTSRVGQGAYRKGLIHRWNYKCAVTDFDKPDLLIASHILPWAQSSDAERLDISNGILLSPVYDALFDRHYITFEDNGKILISPLLSKIACKKIGVTGNEVIRSFSKENLGYLEQHRSFFNEIII